MRNRILAFTLIVLIGLGITGGYQFYSIYSIGEHAEPHEADVILVLGAGMWEHGPGPSLLARTLHAAELFKEGYAPHIIVSGGLGTYPPAEAVAMGDILIGQGVPEEVIHLEDQATNTNENFSYSYQIMKSNGWESVLIVTDSFHVKRSQLIARQYPIEVFASSVKDSVLYHNKSLRYYYMFREVAALIWYRIKGNI